MFKDSLGRIRDMYGNRLIMRAYSSRSTEDLRTAFEYLFTLNAEDALPVGDRDDMFRMINELTSGSPSIIVAHRHNEPILTDEFIEKFYDHDAAWNTIRLIMYKLTTSTKIKLYMKMKWGL